MRQSAKQEATERDAALTKLRALLPPGSTVYCILRHVSRSGMQRTVDPFIVGSDLRPHRLQYLLAPLGFRTDRNRGGIVLGGCGMDVGWHLVFTLSRMLYPDGFGCIGDGGGDYARRCPSNDHSNGDRDYTPHDDIATPALEYYGTQPPGELIGGGYFHWHSAGDYALRMEWV